MGTVRASLALALLAAGCGAAGCGGPPAASPPAAPAAKAPAPPGPPAPAPVAPPAAHPSGAVHEGGEDGADTEPVPRLPAPGEDPDFPAKRPPGPGDWLACFKETGQTVAAYRSDCVNRKAPDRRTIVVQPLGGIADRHGQVLEQVRRYLALFFAVDAVVEKPIPLPKEFRNARRRQWDGDRILLDLQVRLPGRALAYLGFTEEDLYAQGLNFVFGVATPFRRAGVYSLSRYGGDGDAAFLRRTLRVATHEAGHILGLEHCVRYECLMNGVNSVEEMDRAPLFPCPECLEKLRWNARFEPRARYGALAAFFEEAGLEEEAAFARRQEAKRAAPPAAR